MTIHEAQLSPEEVYGLLVRSDKDFDPCLSEALDLKAYAEKWSRLARQIVAIENDTVVGCLVYSLNEQDRRVYIPHFWTDREFRRQGVGKGMFQHLLTNTGDGFDSVELEVLKDNAPAVSFYESLGFLPKEDRGDKWLMGRTQQKAMGDPFKYTVCIHCMTYNQEHFIEDALKGFVMQKTDFPFVAVVVDDHSSDGTADIVRRYAEAWPDIIKAVCLEENYHSQGKDKQVFLNPYDKDAKYIALCEGDDYWTDPLKLQKQVDFLESHPDHVLCCTAFTQTENGDETHPSVIAFDYDEIGLDDILKGAWIGTLTSLFRNDAIADYKIPFPDLPMGDLPLWCHLAMKGKVKYLRDVTANYRRLQDSACHSADAEKESRFRVEAMRVREYYASKAGRLGVVQPSFRKNAHYLLDQCFKNKWLDFPVDRLWHFVREYGRPSGYDKLKRWGLRSNLSHSVAKTILKIRNK